MNMTMVFFNTGNCPARTPIYAVVWCAYVSSWAPVPKDSIVTVTDRAVMRVLRSIILLGLSSQVPLVVLVGVAGWSQFLPGGVSPGSKR